MVRYNNSWNEDHDRHNGVGSIIPPPLKYVIVYFSQQKQTEEMAHAFFNCYDKSGWKNTKGKGIKNWKVHAWQWIWDKKSKMQKRGLPR